MIGPMDVGDNREAARPAGDRLRVALLEPWLGGSHAAFAESLEARSRHDVTVLGLAPRHWRWRQEASAWELGRAAAGVERPDVLLVTDYVDLPRLFGFLPPRWRELPVAAYFHENQLTYPVADGPARADTAPGFANVLTAIRADAVVFNSEFHRDSFAAAADALLARLPRPNPRAELARAIERAEVVPPLPELSRVPVGRGARPGAPLRVAFPHRLEPDKDPAGFLAAVADVARNAPIEAVLTGGEPASAREEIRAALERAGAVVAHAGRVEDRAAYLALLGASDVVASTARHEFFGVAVCEALAAGCAPALPPRLAYPALLSGSDATPGLTSDLGATLRALAADPAPLREQERRARNRAAVMHLDAAGPRGASALDAVLAGIA